MTSTITGQTNAYFTDTNTVTGKIQAGIWQSTLKIIKEGLQGQGKGKGNEIFAVVQNEGADMKSTGKYEVYYSETGDPQKVGSAIFNANFKNDKKLKDGQKIDVKYNPENNGVYKFKVYLAGDEDHAVWSKAIEVTSIEDKKMKEVEEQEQQETEKQEKDVKEPEAVETETPLEQAKNNQNEKTAETPEEKPVEEPTRQESTKPVPEKKTAEQKKEEVTNEEKVQPNSSSTEQLAPVETENNEVKAGE